MTADPDPNAQPTRPDPTGEEPSVRTPSLRNALGLFLLWLIVLVLVGPLLASLVSLAGVDFRPETQRGFAVVVALQGGITVAVIAWGLRRGGLDAAATLRLRPYRQWLVYLVAIPTLLAIGVLTSLAVAQLARWLPGLEPNALAELVRRSRFGDPGSFAIFGAAISLIPGITEELLLRGYILTGLRAKLGPTTAIGATAVLFAVVHLEPIHMLLVLPAGLFLGYLVVRTESLYPAIVAHAANNLWATVEAAMWQSARPDVSADEIITGATYPPTMIVGAILIVVLGLRLIHRRTAPTVDVREPSSTVG
ncbi:MAG: lysostaphin resistance A-like protein [Candidatus Bipolaricaulia bacterium]